MAIEREVKFEEEPKTEEEANERIGEEEDKLREIRSRQTVELTRRMTELSQKVSELSDKLGKSTLIAPEMDEVRSKPVRDPVEKAAKPKRSETKDKAEKKVKEILDSDENNKKDSEPDNKKPADQKEWAGSKFMYLVTGLTLFGPMLMQMFEGLYKAMTGKSLDGLGLPDEVTAKLMAFAAEKKAETSEAYWKDIADYIAKSPNATSADLIMLLQFIVKTNPLTMPFMWSSFEDAGNMALELAPQYTADRTKFFTGLATLKTKDKRPLPRATAAGVAQNAIALTLVTPTA
ncbi:hypothetical protein [Elioraea sp.]|uniref:hypothetical protein n=1 Tax=Elioraea sp. TaxID=2185103 RepID=UPI0025C0E5FA|nr:hypothetical protein [Elioraea sp.]